ncbi:MAG: TIR domain-containing protein [Pseudomonadales bacterium]
MEQPAPAYEGEEPFVFVSYSHQDEALVYREIRWLQDQGVNVWYDTQIQAGSEWSDALANAISRCSRFLYFITPSSVASENCRRELNHAIEEGRSILAVHLKETVVPGGIRLTLNNRQAILKYRLKPEDYRSTLLGALSIGSDGPEPVTAVATPTKRNLRLVSAIAATLLVAVSVVSAVWLLQRTPEPHDKASNLLERSLAVLPLTVVGEDPVAMNLAQTLTEELRATVAGYQELHTVAPLDDADSPELDTSYRLRGNVQRLGDSLSVRVSLIRSDNRDTVWAQAFTHPVSAGASAAPELATMVGRILRKQIVVDQMCEPVRRTSRIQEAADAYCAAVAESHGGAVGGEYDYSLALSQALRAVALDPDIADAHFFVGFNYVWLGEGDQMDWRDAARKARGALDRGLALDSKSPRAFGLLARIENLEMNYPEAELSFRESISRDPLLPRAGPHYGRLGMLAYASGRITEALEHVRRALRIDDSNALQYAILSILLRCAGDDSEAVKAADAGLELVDTGLIRALLLRNKVEAYKAQGESSKANELLDEAIASTGSEWRPILAMTIASLGRTEAARELLGGLERLEQPPTAIMAEAYARLGDDRAFDWIHTAIDRHSLWVVSGLRAKPVYSRLRNDPRWAKVMSHLEAEEARGSAGQNRQS